MFASIWLLLFHRNICAVVHRRLFGFSVYFCSTFAHGGGFGEVVGHVVVVGEKVVDFAGWGHCLAPP